MAHIPLIWRVVGGILLTAVLGLVFILAADDPIHTMRLGRHRPDHS